MANFNKVSVLLPVKNGIAFIDNAVMSVLQQTYSNFELIVIDDGSVDGTIDYLKSICDPRLKLLFNSGSGLVDALNTGLRNVSGVYVARMDADDICLPNRFAVQVDVLNSDNRVGVVFSDIERIDEMGRTIGVSRSSILNNENIRDQLVLKAFGKPIVHPSVMMRLDPLLAVGGYRTYSCAEDKDLWLRLIDICNFRRVNVPLLKYRINSQGVSALNLNKQKANSLLAVLNYKLHTILGVDLYVEHYSLWCDFQRLLMSYAISQDPAVKSFELAKSCVFNKKYLDASLLVFNNLLRSPRYFFPRLRLKEDERIVTHMLWLAQRLVENTKLLRS